MVRFQSGVVARMAALEELVELVTEAVTPPRRAVAIASPRKAFEMWITDESLQSPAKEEGEEMEESKEVKEIMEVVKEDEGEKMEAVKEEEETVEVMESSLLLRSSTDEGMVSDSDSDIMIEEVVDKKLKSEEKVKDLNVKTSEEKLGEERIANRLPPGLKVTVSKQKDLKAKLEGERKPIEVTLDSSDDEDEKENSGVTLKRVSSSPRLKERVKSGSFKERVRSGSKLRERVVSSPRVKERARSGSRVKERVVSGSKVKERVVSGAKVKECSVWLKPVSAGPPGVCGECGQAAGGRAALAPSPGALPEARAVREEAISVISWEDSREHRWPLTFKGRL